MTSLINLLIASFLAMSPSPTPAQAATASLAAPPAAKGADSQQKQEQFQRKFLKQVPKYDPAVPRVGATLQAKRVR